MFGLWTGGLVSNVTRPPILRAEQKRGGAEPSAMTSGIRISSKVAW
jgi:hypothetical protein